MTTRIATLAQPLIVSTLIGFAATTFYAIPVKLCEYARQLAWTLSTAFMPMFSELESKNEGDLLRKIYLNYTRYLFLALMPISILLFIYGNPFISLWIGPEYAEKAEIVLAMLVGALLIESSQAILWRFFIGVGELNVLVKVSAVSSLTVVALGAILAKPFNIEGVAFSVLFGAAVSHLLFAIHTCRYLEITLFSMFTRVHARPLLAGILLFGVAWLFRAQIGSDSYLDMFFGCATGIAMFLGFAWLLALTADERAFAVARIRRRNSAPPSSPA
jgi:O-antigen/teichoic acid export membrane protein